MRKLLKDLVAEYGRKRHKIKKRLKEFSSLRKARNRNEDLFEELCFCLLTPQSKAVWCDRAIKELRRCNLLFRGNREAVRDKLKNVRFPNNKTEYLLAARKCSDIKKRLNINGPFKMREWLVKNIKGLGYKEASHFLRNVGLGKNLAILDVHILKNLKRYGVIKSIPSSMSKKNYIDTEGKMRDFSRKVKIPLPDLDLLFWSQETGFVFK